MHSIDPLIILFGLGVGLLIGLTGVGGGSLMTPLLILVVGAQPVVAIGTDLAYSAITKTLGGWRHFRQGTVDRPLAAWMAVGSVPGAVVGSVAVARLHAAYGRDFDSLLLWILGAVLLAGAVAAVVRTIFVASRAPGERVEVPITPAVKARAVTLGVVLGTVLGVTSVGSGVLIGLVLMLVFRLTPQRVVGTDVFHAAILLWVAALAHLATASIDVGLVVNLLLGSLPGVWVGTALMTRVEGSALRPILSAVVFASALAILSRAGIPIPTGVIVAIPLAVASLLWMYSRRHTHGVPRTALAPEGL